MSITSEDLAIQQFLVGAAPDLPDLSGMNDDDAIHTYRQGLRFARQEIRRLQAELNVAKARKDERL